jgi:DNA-binding CsgD family transcriptional regulator
MTDSASHADLVEDLYASALSPEALIEVLGRAVAEVGASGGNIHVVEKATLNTLLFAPHGPRYAPQAIEDYFKHWRHVNLHRAGMRRAGGVFLCHEHLCDKALARAPYAQDFYFRMGERWLAGAVAADQRHEVSLVFNRSRGQPHFDDGAKHFIGALLPHVRRAASLTVSSAREAGLGRTLEQGLARSSRPAWLVDARLRVFWANEAGEALLRQGAIMQQSAGRLALDDRGGHARLAALVASAVNRRLDGAGAEAMVVEDETRTLELEVMPATVPDHALRGVEALAMVLGRQTGLKDDAHERLRLRFRLTRTEARLAVEVATGAELDAIAAARGVSPETVRTQLRAIYNKTGACRQAELTALVWRLGS